MKCLSINLWNTNEPFKIRMERLKTYICKNNPDIICLQEMSFINKISQVSFLQDEFNYNVIYSKSGVWEGREEGLAIATKHKVIYSNSLNLPTKNAYNDMQRIVLCVSVLIEGIEVTVFNTHLAYHINSAKCREYQALFIKELINNNPSSNIILCGDFNRFDNENNDFYSLVQRNLVNVKMPPYDSSCDDKSFSKSNCFVSDELWPNRNIDYIFVSPNGEFINTLCMNSNDGFFPCSDHYGIITKGHFINEL